MIKHVLIKGPFGSQKLCMNFKGVHEFQRNTLPMGLQICLMASITLREQHYKLYYASWEINPTQCLCMKGRNLQCLYIRCRGGNQNKVSKIRSIYLSFSYFLVGSLIKQGMLHQWRSECVPLSFHPVGILIEKNKINRQLHGLSVSPVSPQMNYTTLNK